ncbi:hypothetical protein EAF00_009797 [Botryotinia globosa]|nr:hypothetical protein EAF00_009797 [Botryotinia globosa]
MAARFSRLFDDWDQDHRDITMLEYGPDVNDSPPRCHSSQNSTEYISPSADLSERPDLPEPVLEPTTPFSPLDDGISTRHLLDGRGSYASSYSPSFPSAHDYQALKGVGRDSLIDDPSPSGARLKNGSGVTSNMKRIWSKSTAFTKPRPQPSFDGHFAQGKYGWWKKQITKSTAKLSQGFGCQTSANHVDQYNTNALGNSTSFATVVVTYNQNCTEYKGRGTVDEALAEVNYTGSVKNHCLTYGDVIVASVINPDLKIHNECLLNSGDGYRYKVSHQCHKHCKDPIPSTTGDDIGHCQKCKKFNETDKAADLPHPSIAIKYRLSLLSNLGSTAITQMIILMFCSFAMAGVSIMLITLMVSKTTDYKHYCRNPDYNREYYRDESIAFAISNGAPFLFSLLYLLRIYNITLISMEHEWGTFETKRTKPRATIVSGTPFEQSYFLQLPSKILLPLMTFAAAMHWLLGESIATFESIYTDPAYGVEHSVHYVTYAAYPIFLSTVLMIGQTAICWWAFTYRREGFIPRMYGSIRACRASTSELEDLGRGSIQWGDLGMGEKFRHAGFSADEPSKIIPAELYCGRD